MSDRDRNPESYVAREIRRWREQHRLTAQQLADRIAADGGKLSRQAISKIENEDRGVSIDELVLVAKALNIPPILLMFPVLGGDLVEVVPGVPAPSEAVLKWFTGEGPFPLSIEEYNRLYGRGEQDQTTGFYERYEGPYLETSPGVVTHEWEQGAAPILLLRRHDELLREWFDAPRELARRELDGSAEERDPGGRFRLAARRNRIEEALHANRTEMRRHPRLTPPKLPEQLQHVEADPRHGSTQ